MIKGLPPGTILQLMYLKERLASMRPGRFVEIGPGAGHITALLLESGWTGVVFDLDPITIDALSSRFRDFIGPGRLTLHTADFTASGSLLGEPVDLVISCMVMEHLDEGQETAFMLAASRVLRAGGQMIGLVPGSPAAWGIEDDIAGHLRRYTRESINALVDRTGWKLRHACGLTYPVSNWLLPVSNWLVARHERNKLALSTLDRTKHSGRRQVRFKTHFPLVLNLLLNDITLRPLHWFQKMAGSAEAALVLYFEAQPTKVP